MNNAIEEVKKRIDIINFIGGFITLKKSGRNFKAICPFHQEKTPSLIISSDRQIWHCFGACQTGGDVISFLMKWERLTFYEALKELAEKAGVTLSKIDFEDQIWQKKEKLLTLNNAAFEFYHHLLVKHIVGKKARDYLSKRGVDQKLIETFGLGYSPLSWDSLLRFLKKKGFTLADSCEAGLLVKNEKGHYYDRFRKRIIFPIYNASSQIIGFSGRILDQSSAAKYINISETPIYHKRETLFGINIAKETMKKTNIAILVEGEFDMISCFKEGITNVTAVKGAAVTYDQLMLLKRFAKKVIFCLDADFSGQETTKKAIRDAENLDFEIGVAVFPFKDPDEAVKNDPIRFKESIVKPRPIYDFLIDIACKRHDSGDAAAKKNIGDEIVPYLLGIKNPIVQSYYIKKLAETLEVETRSIESLMAKMKRITIKPKMRIVPTVRSEIDRFELIQKYILHLILQDEDPTDLIVKVKNILEAKDFTIPAYQKLWINLISYLEKHDSFDTGEFANQLPKELLPVFDQIVLFDINIFDQTLEEKTLNRTLYIFKRLSLKKQIEDVMKQDEKEDVIKNLMRFLSEVEKKLAVI